MKHVKLIAALLVAVGISGCATTETATRNTPFIAGEQLPELQGVPLAMANVDVVDIVVEVPKSLIASEENGYYPRGDIVWRGEPAGDRHLQVKQIFEEGFERGVAGFNGAVPVIVAVEVERFHSVTEKTRYTIGGVHSIRFNMALYHAQTGQPLTERKVVKADLRAYGGQRAVNAERQGLTQRVRVVSHLSGVIQTELGRPPRDEAPIAGLVLDDGDEI